MEKRLRPIDPLVARMEAKRDAEWAARLADKPKTQPPSAPAEKLSWLARAANWWSSLRNFVLNVVGTAIFVGASVLLYDAVMQPTIAIAPISVPEALEKSGYTSEIAANELRAALNKVMENAKSRKEAASVAGRSDIPDIVVPRTGLSVETIAAQVRKLFGLTNRWQAAGGIGKDGDEYELHLKITNDKKVGIVSAPIKAKKIDRLMDATAREILDAADPYLLAAFYYESDPDKSIELANKIIEREPDSEAGGLWAHSLMCGIMRTNRHDLDGARMECERAIAFEKKRPLMFKAAAVIAKTFLNSRIDCRYAVPHVNLGNVLKDQRKREEAIVEYKKAIELDSNYALPHNNLGIVLRDQGKDEEAVIEYKEAIKLDSNYALPHNNLGIVLKGQGKTEEAIAEYKKAIELDPKYAQPHNNLGIVLKEQGKRDEAIAEYKEAIKLDSNDALPHNNLGNVLRDQGKRDEAVAEYKKAIKLDSNYALPHNNLGNMLKDLGERDEAIAEFRKAVELEPQNHWFQFDLDDALAEQRHQNKSVGAAEPTKRHKR